MHVRVLAFARLRELLGGAAHELQMEEGASVADVWDALADRYAGLRPLAQSTRFARNGRLAAAAERIEDGDELALLPPVGGG
jgi:molybdopterin converting factor small subunit